jgi:AraC family transcriptional regulator of adaptative response / DNA-3-methyladenine glycosylase II
MLDFDTCNAARSRRDPAYDGLFFTAVKTTRAPFVRSSSR